MLVGLCKEAECVSEMAHDEMAHECVFEMAQPSIWHTQLLMTIKHSKEAVIDMCMLVKHFFHGGCVITQKHDFPNISQKMVRSCVFLTSKLL